MKRYDRVVYDCPAGPWTGTVLQVSDKYFGTIDWRNDKRRFPGVMVLFDGFCRGRWMSPSSLTPVGNQVALR